MANAKFIDATTWGNLTEIDVTDGENLFPQLPAGTYRPVLSGVGSVTVPALSAGTIDQATPSEGDTLTVSGSNATGSATYQWQKDGVDISGATGASLDTTGEGTGDYRRGVSDGVQGPVYTSAVTVGAAATAPAQMGAPTVTATGSDSISVDLAAAPSDGGSAITSYDLRHSTDESTWTTVTGITDPQTVSGLTASTLYYVQTRAVNAVGAGTWSTSGTATTDAASGASATDNFSYTGNLEDQAVWTPLNTHSGPKPQANGSVAYVASASQNSSWIMENQTVLANDQACEIAFSNVGVGSGNKFHLLLRMTDENNYYRVEIRDGTIKDIDKCVAGVFTEIASNDTAVTPGDVIRFEAEGTALRVKVNGTTQLSGTDAAHASGKSGIHFDVAGGVITTDATIDYFTAEDL